MNHISWMLYLGSVVGSLSIFTFLSMIVCLGVFSAMAVVGAISADTTYHQPERNLAITTAREQRHKSAKLWLPLALVFGIISCFLPSTYTFNMIAASEISGTAVSSPEGQEILGLLKDRIKDALKESEKKND